MTRSVTSMRMDMEEEHVAATLTSGFVSPWRLGGCQEKSAVVHRFHLAFQINVRVTTMDAELEFAIQPNTTGKQLFDQVSPCSREIRCLGGAGQTGTFCSIQIPLLSELPGLAHLK